MVDVSTRIRRAIHLQDLTLLKRIINNNPAQLQNPDYADNSNTSLHLAAKLGLLDFAEYLIEAGHEHGGISRNADGDTPLHLAVENSVPVAELLARRFPRCIGWKNGQGADALMLTSRTPHTQLIPLLLSLSPQTQPPTNLLTSTDISGNTPLHYASAHGQLKSIRTLLEHGADASARNKYNWTALSYSASVQAEVYFRGLVGAAEREKEVLGRKVDGGVGGSGRKRSRSRGGSGGRVTPGGVRLVSGEEERDREREEEWMRLRAGSSGSAGSRGRVRAGSGE